MDAMITALDGALVGFTYVSSFPRRICVLNPY